MLFYFFLNKKALKKDLIKNSYYQRNKLILYLNSCMFDLQRYSQTFAPGQKKICLFI